MGERAGGKRQSALPSLCTSTDQRADLRPAQLERARRVKCASTVDFGESCVPAAPKLQAPRNRRFRSCISKFCSRTQHCPSGSACARTGQPSRTSPDLHSVILFLAVDFSQAGVHLGMEAHASWSRAIPLTTEMFLECNDEGAEPREWFVPETTGRSSRASQPQRRVRWAG